MTVLSRVSVSPGGAVLREFFPGYNDLQPEMNKIVDRIAGSLPRAAALFAAVFILCQGYAQEIVREGRPVATIVVKVSEAPELPAITRRQQRRQRAPSPDEEAAETLAAWIEKMSGARLQVVPLEAAPTSGALIFIGAAAIEQGLDLTGIDSPTSEGLRIVADGRNRILLGGQSGGATIRAACRLLERLGCRYLMDHPLGEVFPKTENVRLDAFDHSEKPAFLSRKISGSGWSQPSLWKVWNGLGGQDLRTGHSWGRYVDVARFATNPEWFALRQGERRPGDWYCTSNSDLRAAFAEGVIAEIRRAGGSSASISPPDANGYCECEPCRAQDDPDSIERSSQQVSKSNRYAHFFDDIARRVAAEFPDVSLNFYCYADYTQAPTSGISLHPNLIAWTAALRACRFHPIGHPSCPSRMHVDRILRGWSESASRIAYYAYNFNVADCLVPVSLVHVLRRDIPLLRDRGCVAINFETLSSWHIYAPHVYLSIRLAYDPTLDVDALLDDYFLRMFGSDAGPLVQRYWQEIDEACNRLDVHTGSVYALHHIYTPERVAKLRGLLDNAGRAAKNDPEVSARLAVTEHGLRNAEQFMAIREAINRGRVEEASQLAAQFRDRNENLISQGVSNRYTVTYFDRFVLRFIEAAADAASGESRIALVLPDTWRMTYDETDKGLDAGYASPEFDDSTWRSVRTFSDSLNAQGFEDKLTVMWYRTSFSLPEGAINPRLFFMEIDGRARVFINGSEIGGSERPRSPFAVPIGPHAQAGRLNSVVVRVDHSRLTELDLGGLIRPVYLVVD